MTFRPVEIFVSNWLEPHFAHLKLPSGWTSSRPVRGTRVPGGGAASANRVHLSRCSHSLWGLPVVCSLTTSARSWILRVRLSSRSPGLEKMLHCARIVLPLGREFCLVEVRSRVHPLSVEDRPRRRKAVPHSCPKRRELRDSTMRAAVPGSPANPHGCRAE